jgi:hypothetical protein
LPYRDRACARITFPGPALRCTRISPWILVCIRQLKENTEMYCLLKGKYINVLNTKRKYRNVLFTEMHIRQQ